MQVPPFAQDVAVQGFTGVSHMVPVNSGRHSQLNPVTPEAEQVPEFMHGFGLQAMSMSQSDPVNPGLQPQSLFAST